MSTQQSTQEFKNENLTVILSKEPGSKAKLDVTVTPRATNAAYLTAIKNVSKEVTLPGFRKGKAPDTLILQHYKKQVDSEWHDTLLNTGFREACDLVQLFPLNQKVIKNPQITHINRETGSQFSIEFEAAPTVPSIDFKELTINTVEKIAIAPEKITEAIDEVRMQHATWEEISDRIIQEGDFVDLDIDSLDNPGQNICSDTRFEVKKGKLGTWLHTLLMGKNVNDTFEGTSEEECDDDQQCNDPSHHHDHFVPTHCQVKIKSIKKCILPEVDDEFAKKVGAENTDQFKERITKTLDKQAEEMVNLKLGEQIDNILAEKYTFDIPASIINPEKQSRIAHRITHLKEEELTEERKKEIEDSVSKEIERDYRLYFLIQKVAEDHKLDVSSDEIMQEFMIQAYMSNGQGIIQPQMDPKEIQQRLYAYLLTKKAKSLLIKEAVKA